MPLKPRATELGRLLNASNLPIYALDDDRRIVFVNAACAAWTGVEPDDMLGRQCNYTSAVELEGPDAVAALLCPPPGAFDGGDDSGSVSCRTAAGEIQTRSARFVAIPGSGGDGGVLVMVASDAQPPSPAMPQIEGDSAALHGRLQKLRAKLRGRHAIDGLLGDAPAIRRARSQAWLAAESRAAVLIAGLIGSGHEDLARAIHYQSGSPGRLVPLSCAVLGIELLASTIQAVAASEPAEPDPPRSTVLLTEVDQLPAEAQAELERVLEPCPLRVIATAQEPLASFLGQARLRPELAGLLSVITIDLPQLVDRLGDIPLLAQACLEAENARGGKQVAGFTSEALDELAGYGWPENMAELAGAIREAHAQAQGRLISPADLPKRITLAADAAAQTKRVPQPINLEQTMARVETQLIERALARAGGNKSRAAELLGMTRPRLYRRLVQLGLAEEGTDSPVSE